MIIDSRYFQGASRSSLATHDLCVKRGLRVVGN